MMMIHSGKVFNRIDVPSVLSADVEHKIAAGTPRFEWKGAKIPYDLMCKAKAFFEWTYKTHACESQVRFFYSESEQRWGVWAFPQEKRGMETKELSCPEFDEQRKQFGAGWIECATAHHHCSVGAFQSGGDKEDETGVTGLHMTFGNMGSPTYSFHARVAFNYQGAKSFYEPDLSQWFEIPQEYAGLPEKIQSDIISHLLCKPCPEAEFPEQWKANMRERTIQFNHSYGGVGPYGGSYGGVGPYTGKYGGASWGGTKTHSSQTFTPKSNKQPTPGLVLDHVKDDLVSAVESADTTTYTGIIDLVASVGEIMSTYDVAFNDLDEVAAKIDAEIEANDEFATNGGLDTDPDDGTDWSGLHTSDGRTWDT